MILKPSLINYHNMQFLITHAPDNDSLPIYVKVLLSLIYRNSRSTMWRLLCAPANEPTTTSFLKMQEFVSS